ncbi:MAG: HAD hydrolase family protein, partial [Lachnospiraceae bacterium]|nr:HAD hydrolase family protein [Lachnospiraceae bacterium]
KITMDNTYAIGDSFNDLEMLETEKYGVCMENGDPKLLERIPLHARSMKRDGIYHSLKKFGLI